MLNNDTEAIILPLSLLSVIALQLVRLLALLARQTPRPVHFVLSSQHLVLIQIHLAHSLGSIILNLYLLSTKVITLLRPFDRLLYLPQSPCCISVTFVSMEAMPNTNTSNYSLRHFRD